MVIDMTIDEEIEMFNKKSEEYNEDFESCKERVLYTCRGCANCFPKTCDELEKEYKQLAEWLEELKSYRASVFSGDMTHQMLKEEYCKAVDDFAESVKNLIADSSVIRFKDIDEIAEQLKEGGKNE